ncbi:NUDIX domain-containing protein [Nocardioides sp.]|uniref:NUDIX domain-containing protein n=1 Tax=Nocardioides sp. TaxID=35761 RepID=UPI0027220C85|nr:NUDIX hydrolase [Nocardioides sp.]MDO9455015.1 NUDIX hydrolase [Nocardioides sp.]
MSDELEDTPTAWPVLASDDLHRDAWVVALRADKVETPDGHTARRIVMEHPGAAVILAVDDDARVFVLWQYRHAAGHRFVEIPAGLLDGDPGEEPVEVARRELREEAQLQATTWTHLVSSYPSPGISAEVQHLFLARGLSPADRGDFELHHEEADMTAAWVPFDDLHAAVLAGRIGDGPVIQAVLLARARGLV